MERQERTFEILHLENGLDVYFIDQSSAPIAGRCQVRLLIRVPVLAVEDNFHDHPDPSGALRRFISLTGPGPVAFESVKVRNFIDQKEVEKSIEGMKDDFIRSGLQYLKKPGFAATLIARRYEELLAGEAVRSARNAHEKAFWEMEGK